MSGLEAIAERVAGCNRCELSEQRERTVPGSGAADADIMIIGEAPGYNEDKQGLPFVGAAGGVLTELLAGIGLRRDDVYITNMVKCRPPSNRDPQAAEMSACADYLDEQIALIDPKVIVTLGRFSFGKFFPGRSISRERGKPRMWNGRMIYPMYHPAATLHNPRLKPALESDFRNLPAMVEEVIAMAEMGDGADGADAGTAQRADEKPAEQMSMF